METIQLAIRDVPYATALKEALLRNGPFQVRCVEMPNAAQEGVIVLDAATLEAVKANLPLRDIHAAWQENLAEFSRVRAKYLLYPD